MKGKILIVGNYAHRALNNQKIESTTVTIDETGNAVLDNSGWRSRSPQEMGLLGSHTTVIGQVLLNIRNLIREDAPPQVGSQQKVGQNPVGVA